MNSRRRLSKTSDAQSECEARAKEFEELYGCDNSDGCGCEECAVIQNMTNIVASSTQGSDGEAWADAPAVLTDFTNFLHELQQRSHVLNGDAAHSSLVVNVFHQYSKLALAMRAHDGTSFDVAALDKNSKEVVSYVQNFITMCMQVDVLDELHQTDLSQCQGYF